VTFLYSTLVSQARCVKSAPTSRIRENRQSRLYEQDRNLREARSSTHVTNSGYLQLYVSSRRTRRVTPRSAATRGCNVRKSSDLRPTGRPLRLPASATVTWSLRSSGGRFYAHLLPTAYLLTHGCTIPPKQPSTYTKPQSITPVSP